MSNQQRSAEAIKAISATRELFYSGYLNEADCEAQVAAIKSAFAS